MQHWKFNFNFPVLKNERTNKQKEEILQILDICILIWEAW